MREKAILDKALIQIQESLESIKRLTQDNQPLEFWSARDLMAVLGYIKWQKFIATIERAKEACKASKTATQDHFLPAPVKSSGGGQERTTFLPVLHVI